MAHGEASGGPVLPPQRRSLQQRFGPHARARDGRGTVRRLLALYARWGRELLLVVCLTLVFTVICAKVVGCTLPMCAEKIGIDPAVMASPFITTIVDALSLLIYFFIATHLLGLNT